jgi:hypothetical protein
VEQSCNERERQFTGPANDAIAKQLDEIAGHLEEQSANPFRVQAYRNAANTIRRLPSPVCKIVEEQGIDGLLELPGIGSSLAHAIQQFIRTGALPLLERLRGEHAPERILRSVPYLGPQFARRIHEQLGIETLAELERAAWDGRLAQVPGMGRKRIEAIRDSLAGRFRRRLSLPAAPPAKRQSDSPSVAELLDIDQQYRRLVELDRLPKIAPRRFNPEGKAWLPILHAHRGERHYTALYSNTARAHELGTTRDWVVIYRDDSGDHGQWTVITAGLGKLKGKRVVCGREDECAAHYGRLASPPSQIGR